MEDGMVIDFDKEGIPFVDSKGFVSDWASGMQGLDCKDELLMHHAMLE